jgi:hypothetical protein
MAVRLGINSRKNSGNEHDGKKNMKKRICGFILAVILLLTCGCAAWADDGTAIGQNLPDIRGEVEPDMPGIQVEGETDLPGCFYLSFVFSRNLILMDGKGNIVWSKHEEQPEGCFGTGLWDFKKHEFDGEIFYSYHDQTGAYDDYGLLGFAPGERVIMDKNFNEIRRITFEECAPSRSLRSFHRPAALYSIWAAPCL